MLNRARGWTRNPTGPYESLHPILACFPEASPWNKNFIVKAYRKSRLLSSALRYQVVVTKHSGTHRY